MTNNQKVHVIADESLGGVMREFVEVERRAVVGDKARNVNDEHCHAHIIDVHFVQDSGTLFGTNACNEDDSTRYYIEGSRYRTLERTDIVRVNEEVHAESGLWGAQPYRLVERKAEVGEKVIIINARDLNGDSYRNGDIFTIGGVFDLYSGLVHTDGKITLFDLEYLVLEPVKPNLSDLVSRITSENRHEEVPDITDLLANLARRINSLESQLSDTQRNVERQAEEIATLKYLGASNEEDIRNLDDRTQVVNAIQKFYGDASR